MGVVGVNRSDKEVKSNMIHYLKQGAAITAIFIVVYGAFNLYDFLESESPKSLPEIKAELENKINFYKFIRSTILVDITQAEAMISFEEKKNKLFHEWSGLPYPEQPSTEIPKNLHEMAIDSIRQAIRFKKNFVANHDSLLLVYRDSLQHIDLELTQ